MIGRTLTAYFAGHFLRGVAITFATFLVLITAVDMIDQSRRASGVDEAGFLQVTAISASKGLVLAEGIWPFAVFFGAMATLIVLNRRLELVVARGAGVSVWRFLFPAVIAALVTGLFAALVYNPVALAARDAGQDLQERVYGKTRANADAYVEDFWLRTNALAGAYVIHANTAREDGRRLAGVTRYGFDADGRSTDRVDAETFTFVDRGEASVWEAANAVVYPARARDERGPRLGERHERIEFPAFVDRASLKRAATGPDDVPFWSLREEGARVAASGRNALPYETRFQSLLSRPLLYVAMVLLAGTVSLRFARFGLRPGALVLGVAAAFVLYVVAEVVLAFGRNGFVAPWVAAWSPALVATLLASSVLLAQEDG